MDISETTQAKSDQQNYDDYAGGNGLVGLLEVAVVSLPHGAQGHVEPVEGEPLRDGLHGRPDARQVGGVDPVDVEGDVGGAHSSSRSRLRCRSVRGLYSGQEW